MYDVLATYYDVLHQDLIADIAFVQRFATQCDGPILELGCGTGRLIAPLVRAGHVVVGVDNSAEMLSLARAKLASPHVTLVQADMTTLALPNLFELIVISHNTLMHLDPAQLAATLQRVHNHLAPNGRLLIDLENPFQMAAMPDLPTFEMEEPFVDPRSGQLVTPYAKWRVDGGAQVATVDWRYMRADGVQHSAEIRYHYYYPHQLQTALSHSKLRWEDAWGDYDSAEFEEDSPRLIVGATLA